jgi:hypothetical protein
MDIVQERIELARPLRISHALRIYSEIICKSPSMLQSYHFQADTHTGLQLQSDKHASARQFLLTYAMSPRVDVMRDRDHLSRAGEFQPDNRTRLELWQQKMQQQGLEERMTRRTVQQLMTYRKHMMLHNRDLELSITWNPPPTDAEGRQAIIYEYDLQVRGYQQDLWRDLGEIMYSAGLQTYSNL